MLELELGEVLGLKLIFVLDDVGDEVISLLLEETTDDEVVNFVLVAIGDDVVNLLLDVTKLVDDFGIGEDVGVDEVVGIGDDVGVTTGGVYVGAQAPLTEGTALTPVEMGRTLEPQLAAGAIKILELS